jgi:hypothetical protein
VALGDGILVRVPDVDVLDDTFVRADRGAVRAQTGACWPGWLPALRLRLSEDRGDEGVRWLAEGADDPGLAGSAEVWLETVPGGTVVHLYVRLQQAGSVPRGHRGARHAHRLPDRIRRTWKRGLHRWKDQAEGQWAT